ncbi:MAG: PAS domain-containing sensor histidine kinase, partial [Phycisphaerae bacterium]
LVADLRDRPERKERWQDSRYQLLNQRIAEGLTQLHRLTTAEASDASHRGLKALAAKLAPASDDYVSLIDAGNTNEAAQLLQNQIITQYVDPLHEGLANLSSRTNRTLTRTSVGVEQTARDITWLLAANAVIAFLLAATGVHLVRNWVLRPIGALQEAAEQHASGNLDYRIGRITHDELGQLSQDVNRMAGSLLDIQRRLVEQERLAAIGEVTSMLAHNIRNPLAGIRASAQASIADLPASSDVTGRLMTTVQTVDALNVWLRELLVVGQPIHLDRRDAALGELVQRVLSVLQAHARSRDVALDFKTPANGSDLVFVDPARMEQVILSLVDNAVDASPNGGRISLAIDRPEDPAWIELRITDQGPGIAPDVVQRIAQPFVSGKPGGTGLGLYLARRTIEVHGGRLDFDSPDGNGTTVIVRLPASAHQPDGDRPGG